MKRFMRIFLILIISILVIGCTKEKVSNDATKFKDEYEALNNKENNYGKTNREVSIPEDNPIVYATAEEIVDKINNKETFVVYFGFPSCPWCRSMIEELIKSAKDNNQEKVYYVDVYEIRDTFELNEEGNLEKTKEGTSGYNELISLMSDVLSDYNLTNDAGEEIPTGEKRIYAPNVVAVVGGKAEKMIEGTASNLEDPYGKLTDEMKEESYNSMKCLWECLNDVPVCKKNAC